MWKQRSCGKQRGEQGLYSGRKATLGCPTSPQKVPWLPRSRPETDLTWCETALHMRMGNLPRLMTLRVAGLPVAGPGGPGSEDPKGLHHDMTLLGQSGWPSAESQAEANSHLGAQVLILQTPSTCMPTGACRQQ